MKSIAVIGLGQFGFQIAVSLAHKGFDVIALDESVETISEIKDLVLVIMVIFLPFLAAVMAVVMPARPSPIIKISVLF